jgi:hypothetical protein
LAAWETTKVIGHVGKNVMRKDKIPMVLLCDPVINQRLREVLDD